MYLFVTDARLDALLVKRATAGLTVLDKLKAQPIYNPKERCPACGAKTSSVCLRRDEAYGPWAYLRVDCDNCGSYSVRRPMSEKKAKKKGK